MKISWKGLMFLGVMVVVALTATVTGISWGYAASDSDVFQNIRAKADKVVQLADALGGAQLTSETKQDLQKVDADLGKVVEELEGIARRAIPTPAGVCGPGKIDINTAGKEDLLKIIHIGEVRATQLIGLRPFEDLDDMARISGIGPARLADIKEQNIACVSGAEPAPENPCPDGIASNAHPRLLSFVKTAHAQEQCQEFTASIDLLYECVGAEQSWLGSATSGPYTEAATGKPRQDFRDGYIAWVASWNHFYAFSHRSLSDQWLAPKVPKCVQDLSGEQRSIANTYNRIGGQLINLAIKNNLEPEVALAVWQVEAGGGSFGSDGKPIVRFENHVLYRQWGLANSTTYDQYFRPRTGSSRHQVNLSGQCGNSGWTTLHPAGYAVMSDYFQCLQYAALEVAKGIAGNEAAYRSISMGGPQILGESYSLAGYSSAETMFQRFSEAEFHHIKGFFEFMNSKCLINSTTQECFKYLIEYAQEKNWAYVAWLYNGAEPGTTDNEIWKNRFIATYAAAQEVLNPN